MALSESEKLKIAKITSVNFHTITDQIRYLGTNITGEVETEVRAELSKWDEFGGEYTRIHPMPANFGAEIDPEKIKSDIRRNLNVLLYLPLSVYAVSGRLSRS